MEKFDDTARGVHIVWNIRCVQAFGEREGYKVKQFTGLGLAYGEIIPLRSTGLIHGVRM